MVEIDKELKYCPNCKDEYRADFTVCAACDVELVTGQVLLDTATHTSRPHPTSESISEDEQLIKLLSGSLLEMKKVKLLLEDSGIPAILVKDDSCSGGCCGPQIDLYIRPIDGENAQALLLAEHEKNTGLNEFDLVSAEAIFDPEATVVICPACRSEFSPNEAVCPDCELQF